MKNDEKERAQELLWKSQEDEQVELATEELRARAVKYERQSVRMFWVVLGVSLLLIAAFTRNLIHFRELWLILGAAWALLVVCYFAWRVLRHGPNRLHPAEPCVQYLRRELGGKHEGLQSLRLAVLLVCPAIIASWRGGGMVLRAKLMGVTSPWLLRLCGGPAPLIAMALILAFVWFAFSHALRKVDRKIEHLNRE